MPKKRASAATRRRPASPSPLRSAVRRLARWGFFAGAAAGLAIGFAEITIERSAAGRTHDTPLTLPRNRVALVLGCARRLADGRENLYFRHRMRAAADLYQSGKVEYLIVSGDNHRADYDEPTDMRDALIALGVPETRIYRDFAGFRTLDSIVRAREIFGQTSITIVSQPFHNERAIFLARDRGIDAVGLNAAEVSRNAGFLTQARERLARVMTLLDVWLFDTEPRHLGPPVAVGGPPN